MPEEIAVILVLGMLGGMGLTALRMFLSYREKRFAHTGGDDTRRLEETVGGLRDEVYQLRTEMSELGERVDFTERVLAQNREPEPRRLPDH
jgi:hypothetical protein